MEQPRAIAPTAATVGQRFRPGRLRIGWFMMALGLAVLCWMILIVAWSALRIWLA